jgi:hypothetical protein
MWEHDYDCLCVPYGNQAIFHLPFHAAVLVQSVQWLYTTI